MSVSYSAELVEKVFINQELCKKKLFGYFNFKQSKYMRTKICRYYF